MSLLTHRVKEKDLIAGDHIYSWRAGFVYSHHGIYVGQNSVIHYTSGGTGSVGISSSISNKRKGCCSSKVTPHCGFRKPDSGVILSCLACFIKYGSLYQYKYGLTELALSFKIRKGTCTALESDLPNEVIHRAKYLLENGFGNYNLVTHNCEDFALYCKTGLIDTKGRGLSNQIKGICKVTRKLSSFADKLVAKVELPLVVDVPLALLRRCADVATAVCAEDNDIVKISVEYLHAILSATPQEGEHGRNTNEGSS